MKQSPDMQKLEEILRSSALVAGGFMGDDPRTTTEIIDADAADLFSLGATVGQITARMSQITEQAERGLGNWVVIDDHCEAQVDEARGRIPCPWPHRSRHLKRVTTARLTASDKIVRWSDLSLHLIAAHGFFQGKGSPFRMEPADAVDLLP
jgi:hypothetical protein